LDEGTAALYEVSKITQDGVVGINNWRGKLLRRIWHMRPCIGELIKMEWDTFDQIQPGSDAMRQAANHATARCFAHYLQDKGVLTQVFNKIRELTPETHFGTQAKETAKILKTILGKPVNAIDQEFSDWFNSEKVWEID
jgi:hypothetical protein